VRSLASSRGRQRACGRGPGARFACALTIAGSLFIAWVLSGCGLAAGVVSNATLTIYNGQHEQTTIALVDAFTKRTGIKVRVLTDDEDVLSALLAEEGSRSPADIYYTENSNWLALADSRGLLAQVDPSTLAQVPRADSAADGRWVGVTARVSCLVYNTRALRPSQLPTSIMQLAEQKWRGRLGFDSGETDFWPLVVSVEHTYGVARTVDWLHGLKANAGSNLHIPDNETLTYDVNRGVVDLGVINQYYWYRLRAEIGARAMHSRIAYFAPHDPGYVVNISGAAMLKSSKHKQAAQRFLAFMTSAAGQRIIARSDSFEYPLNPHVDPNPQLTPLADLQPSSFSPAQLGTGVLGEQLLVQSGVL
jgi:iron(III) transport system substrate-binding protein